MPCGRRRAARRLPGRAFPAALRAWRGSRKNRLPACSPRTATVTARTDATMYKLARESFLTAVLGHAATQRQAEGIADAG